MSKFLKFFIINSTNILFLAKKSELIYILNKKIDNL